MDQVPNVVRIPTDLVEQVGDLPGHCSRHGRPAVKRVDFALQSKVRPPGSRILSGNVLSAADQISEYAKTVRVAHVKGWPLCPACVRTRVIWFSTAMVMFFGGLVAFAGSLVVGVFVEVPKVFAAVAAIGFVVMVLSAFPFHRASYARVASAATSADGTAVIVVDPNREFTAELPSAGAPPD